MKKSILYSGIGYLVVGVLLMAVASLTVSKFEALLWGFGGAGIGSGISLLWKYLYWSRPEKISSYSEKLRNEKIELEDERKIILRDKSGCITYRIMIGIYCVLIVILSVMSAIGYWMPFSQYLLLCCIVLLVFQYICGIIIFNRLNKKL